MTQQSILHLVVNWEVFTTNICCLLLNFIPNLHLHLVGLLIKLGLRFGGQIYTTMQNFVKLDIRNITFFSIFKTTAVHNLGFSIIYLFFF